MSCEKTYQMTLNTVDPTLAEARITELAVGLGIKPRSVKAQNGAL